MNEFFRFEFKYQILESQIKSLEHDLSALGMKHDDVMEQYTVSSLYFDNYELTDYNAKAGGFIKRIKIRARIYEEGLSENTRVVWLEIKEKNDMTISKRRVSVTPHEWLLLSKALHPPKSLCNRLEKHECRIMNEFIFHISSANRRPVLLVQYMRRPYTYKTAAGTLRITFDYNLHAASASKLSPQQGLTKVMPGKAVMEIKYNNFLPPFMKMIIEKYRLRRDAYSKYALGFEATRKFNPLPR